MVLNIITLTHSVIFVYSQKDITVLPRFISPRFIANLAYHQNSHLSRFPPLKIPHYTAKLNYRHTSENNNTF